MISLRQRIAWRRTSPIQLQTVDFRLTKVRIAGAFEDEPFHEVPDTKSHGTRVGFPAERMTA